MKNQKEKKNERNKMKFKKKKRNCERDTQKKGMKN